MKEIPDITDDLQRYRELVPEFGTPQSKRAAAEINTLEHDEKGEVLPENAIARNIRIFQERIRAKIAQLEGNVVWLRHLHPVKEGWHDIRMGSSPQEFRKAPRTDLKAFQEVLCAPTERMAFERDEKFTTARNIVIDPEMITDTLLANLGLDEFIPKKGTKMEDKIARRAGAIPAIKEMLESLEPFTLPHERELARLKYFRLFRVGGGKNGGKVMGTQVIGEQKVLFLTDLHGASRRIDHINDGYGQEIATLAEIRDMVCDVDVRISRDWQQNKNPQKIAEIKTALLGLVDKLKFVTNEHKKKMRAQIEAAVNMESVYTLPAKRKMVGGVSKVVQPARTVVALNPGKTRARINTSPMHIGRRIEEIAAIRSYLAKDQTRIQTHISAQTKPFEEFYATVRELHEQFKIYRLDRPMAPGERAKAISNLESLQRRCGFATTPVMMFEPYQTFAAELIAHIEKTVEALRKDETPEAREEAAEEFTKIYLVTKIQRFYTELQALYNDFLSGGMVPNFDEFLARLAIMDQGLSRKNVAPGIKTAEFDDVFGELYHLINSVRKRAVQAKEGLTAGLSKEDVKPFAAFMYERIRNFDFVQLMGKIKVRPRRMDDASGSAAS